MFRSLFSVDLRSLAALRIGLGLLTLADLALRARDLTAHYTDSGVTTGEFLLDHYGPATYLSLHYWVGSNPALTAALFAVHALFAFGLLVGFRTRLMTLACWILGASLLKRSPGLYTAGDAAIMFLLFWSLFLPIGARYSVDAALDPREEEPPNEYFSVASAAILLQVCFTYWFAAGMKLSSPMWIDGSAIENALDRDWVVDSVGIWLRRSEPLLPVLTFGALFTELFAPLLAFIPRALCTGRLLAIGIFALVHLGFALCFNFGIFQWQSFAGWIVFLPACFWVRIGARSLDRPERGIRCYYDGECGFCRKTLSLVRELTMFPRSVVQRAQDDPAIYQEMVAENSWVVVDHEGRHRRRFDALAYLLRRNPITWAIGALFGLPGVRHAGNLVYRWIASHRGLCGRLIVWLRWRPVRLRPSIIGSVIAFWVIAYVFVLNVRTLRPELSALTPRVFALPARIIQLDPHWAMFTTVEVLDGWVVIPARLADGSEVDLLTGETPNWDKPALISHRYGSMRWMKLTQSYAGSQSKATTLRWGPYTEHFARRWDRTHDADRRVVKAWLRYVQELPSGGFSPAPYLWAEVERP